MKLNYDCVRDVLLYLEENLGYTENTIALEHKRLSISSISNNITDYTKEDIQYTIEKLEEAEYVRFANVTYDTHNYIVNGYVDDITWKGFEFLNNVREKKIWKATKLGAKKIGAVSISALSMISTEIIKAIITNPSVINEIVSKISS